MRLTVSLRGSEADAKMGSLWWRLTGRAGRRRREEPSACTAGLAPVEGVSRRGGQDKHSSEDSVARQPGGRPSRSHALEESCVPMDWSCLSAHSAQAVAESNPQAVLSSEARSHHCHWGAELRDPPKVTLPLSVELDFTLVGWAQSPCSLPAFLTA